MNILPLYHIAGFSSIIRGLISNRPIHLYNNFKINNLISKVSLQKKKIISLVPTITFKCLIDKYDVIYFFNIHAPYNKINKGCKQEI